MRLQPDDVIWVFDGRDGVRTMLIELVSGYLTSLQHLMPPSALGSFDDPFAAMAADEHFKALDRVEGFRLQRLFPQPLSQEHADADVWEGMVRGRATTLHTHAAAVLAELTGEGDIVPVPEQSVTAWLQTLGALRAALHAELVQSARPDAEPTEKQIEEHPALAAVLDWLAYNIEDLLATRDLCLEAGAGLDMSDREEWE